MNKRILKISICLIASVILMNNFSYANERRYDTITNESQINCWVGWKDIHFGGTTPISKKGEDIVYRSPMLNAEGVFIGYNEGSVTTEGYGYYAFNFSKHIIGLLSYMKNRVSNYMTSYTPIPDEPEYDEFGNLIEPETVYMRDAIDITIRKILGKWYSNDYENNEFASFWNGSFTEEHSEELKKYQNMFYWNAYADSAFNTLVGMMGNYWNELSSAQKTIIRGVLLSVMEVKYRNKDLKAKANLRLIAAEGDICPFLVNLKNLNDIVRSGSDGNYTYIDSKRGYTYYDFPDFDTLIDGVYQWMEYYDKDTIRTTGHSTVTSKLSNGEEGDEIEIDWEQEYMALTNIGLKKIKGRELEDFYSRCWLVRNLFKKSRENTEGIFGSEELYDITSDINFSEALSNMKQAMVDFCRDKPFGSVWSGLTDYNIERTYIMSKNIMESNRVRNEYAYYDIGTNIITYTPGLEGKDYLLMDFQKVRLKEPLTIHDGNRRYRTWADTDNDGIYDRYELGDDGSDGTSDGNMKIKVDITGFIKKAVEKELYGNDTRAIRENQAHIKNVVAEVKYNIYKNRYEFDTDNVDNNKMNWKEEYEHNLNVDADTQQALGALATKDEKINYLKVAPSKLMIELWKYKSNPTLKDTDFDGIDDGKGGELREQLENDYEDEYDRAHPDSSINHYLMAEQTAMHIGYENMKVDKKPKDNHFTGRMNSSRLSGGDGIEVDMTMDYRYFFLSNKLYYDELSTMSLLYANSIYMKDSGIIMKNANNERINGAYKNLRIKDLMKFYGFQDVKVYYMGKNTDQGYDAGINPECKNYDDTHKGSVAIGYKNIEYHGLYKTVIGIVIRGTAEDDDWDSDFDIGDIRIKELIDNNQLNNSKLRELGYDTQQYRTELNHFIDGYANWTHKQHHAGFDIVTNRILEIVKEYVDANESKFGYDEYDNNAVNNVVGHTNGGDEICFWVTGHSMGGGVANIVAAELVNGTCGGNPDNVYCYTFAAPNTFYWTDNGEERDSAAFPGHKVLENYIEPHGAKYRCIFNTVNSDDFVPEVPMTKCNWTKYGRTASISFNINKAKIETIVKNEKKYDTLHYDWTTTKRFINEYKGNKETIESIVNSFNSIFENDYSNMRYDTYDFGKDCYAQISKAPSAEWIIPDNTKPYQKIYVTNMYNLDYQMPAYFMQYLSFAMHGAFPSFGFWKASFNKRFTRTKDIIVEKKELIQDPHFLESYYLVTKKISIIDFN